MLMVISPAKTLDYKTPPVTNKSTQPQFVTEAQLLVDAMRAFTPAELGGLMKISDKLAGLNVARFAEWQPSFTKENSKQALLAFKGDVYTGLDAESLDEADLDYAQTHLRMLSGLYGLLRPLDLMQPYRLEMGTKVANPRGKDLYQFWGDSLTDTLNAYMQEQGLSTLLNLASNEYFKVLKPARLEAALVNVDFKDQKNGEYKIISFYAKKARGMMARYIIQNRIRSVSGLRNFDVDGYYFSEEQSRPDHLVFLRNHVEG